MSLSAAQFRNIAVLAARHSDQKKAEDISLLDLRHTQAGLCDFALLMSATSEAHIRALRDSIEDLLEGIGLHRLHRDAGGGAHWVILDYGGLLVHIFHHASRAFYTLERLWENARQVAWAESPERPSARPSRRKPSGRKARK